jgi:hypothetical protein
MKYLYDMLVRFTKNMNKRHTIKYVRDNGSETWMQADDFFVQHDLSHFALEKALGYKTAFNGMINNGMDIKDFEDREKRKAMKITAEAAYAENMANLFLGELSQGELEDSNKVQQGTLQAISKEMPPLELTDDKICETREYLRELVKRWNELAPGQTLELEFAL